MDQLLPARSVPRPPCGYLRHYTWRRVITWLRHKHPRGNWKQLKRRYLDTGWWPSDGNVALFNPAAVRVTRYRYHRTRIPTPRTHQPSTPTDPWRAGCGESRTSASRGADHRNRPIETSARRPGPTLLVHRRLDPGTAGTTTPPPRAAAPNIRAGPASEPGSRSCGGRIISQTGTTSISTAYSTLTPGSALPGTLSRSPLPAVRSRRPRRRRPSTRTVRRPLRDRPDTANTTTSWTPSSPGEKKSWPTTAADEQPTDPSKGSTTSSKSYAASLTGSPTTTTTQPEEFS